MGASFSVDYKVVSYKTTIKYTCRSFILYIYIEGGGVHWNDLLNDLLIGIVSHLTQCPILCWFRLTYAVH